MYSCIYLFYVYSMDDEKSPMVVDYPVVYPSNPPSYQTIYIQPAYHPTQAASNYVNPNRSRNVGFFIFILFIICVIAIAFIFSK